MLHWIAGFFDTFEKHAPCSLFKVASCLVLAHDIPLTAPERIGFCAWVCLKIGCPKIHRLIKSVPLLKQLFGAILHFQTPIFRITWIYGAYIEPNRCGHIDIGQQTCHCGADAFM